ncbi:aminotransferase class IV [Cyanobium sp. Morenito 9A2]|uniref:aminotransferase class IV n=1 Tax=Cyanobium sp. Morenito 9A2 TaxID=2823718 RepID=UPI0020CD7055|nr:aminotransferase class IV [Cyanobium sp. Morenito 9A2]MCP9850464.1 aminotransferase class IV [Cyanobium sp. Morenito 9A2]
MNPIAWIGDPSGGPLTGQWGEPGALGLPLNDRGLSLADGLFETVLVEDREPLLLAEHLERWRQSAEWLALPPPPGADQVRALLAEALRRRGHADGALRLNGSRGAADGRGIELPSTAAESARPAETASRFWLQFNPGVAQFTPVPVLISRLERRNASSLVSRCKTFAYGQAIQARREARAAGAGDALLLSTAGGLSCGTTANVLIQRNGNWWTPPLASGCLAGVMRGRALALGLAAEMDLRTDDLVNADAALLINSLGCRPITAVDGVPLNGPGATEAEAFWRRLL